MKITASQTEKLLKGEHKFTQLGFSMMMVRLRALYKRDSSSSTVQTCVDEINKFMDKFSGVMADDFAVISKL